MHFFLNKTITVTLYLSLPSDLLARAVTDKSFLYELKKDNTICVAVVVFVCNIKKNELPKMGVKSLHLHIL